ncbi:MAG: hypothetical protein AB8G77_15135 [Rhodothermales bacterium]
MEANATIIEEIQISPNPVAIGGEAEIRCAIRDSLASGFNFDWTLSNASTLPDLFDTDSCEAKWTAPSSPGEYEHRLMISRVGYRAITHEFTITVIER